MGGAQAFDERFGFRVKGTFRVRGYFEIPLTIVAALLYVVLGGIIVLWMAQPATAFGGTFPAVPLFIAVWTIFCWWLVRIAHSGVTCSYEGNDDEFCITDFRHHTEIFYYPDVEEVEYKPMKYLNDRLRGYYVTIRTKYRTVSYEFIALGRQPLRSPEDTPFYELERHSKFIRGDKSGEKSE